MFGFGLLFVFYFVGFLFCLGFLFLFIGRVLGFFCLVFFLFKLFYYQTELHKILGSIINFSS